MPKITIHYTVYSSSSRIHHHVLPFFFDTRYLDPDMYSMMEDNSDTIRSTKFKKLTEAICGLVSKALKVDDFILDQNLE